MEVVKDRVGADKRQQKIADIGRSRLVPDAIEIRRIVSTSENEAIAETRGGQSSSIATTVTAVSVPAPAPALSPFGLLIGVLTLGAIARARLRSGAPDRRG